MRCSNCKAEHPAGQRFCGDCGAPLANLCPKCVPIIQWANALWPVRHGARSTAAAASAKKSNDSVIRVTETPAHENIEGERKMVTTLFADIKGSMKLIEALDPEDAKMLARSSIQLCS